MKNRLSMFQIREAIFKNVCGAADKEFSLVKDMNTNLKIEGDSQLRLILFVGICTAHKYTSSDITTIANLRNEEEFRSKLRRYNRNAKSNKRFINKIKLINNYLKIHYGI